MIALGLRLSIHRWPKAYECSMGGHHLKMSPIIAKSWLILYSFVCLLFVQISEPKFNTFWFEFFKIYVKPYI